MRTWTYYTILKGHTHSDSKPWDSIMLSGMGLIEEGKDFSKSKNRVIKPENICEEYSADALRWWSSKVKLGEDLVFKEDDLVAGQKLIDKLWNVGKFLNQFMDSREERLQRPENFSTMDKWLLNKRDSVVSEATEKFEDFKYDRSKELVREFFWHHLADEFLEIQKGKLYDDDEASLFTLYTCFLDCLKMLAPIMPHITEDLYQEIYREYEGEKSIHVSKWPEKSGFDFEESHSRGEKIIELVSGLRKYKTGNGLALNTELEKVKIYTEEDLNTSILKQAMNISQVEILDEMPGISKQVTEIKLDYSKAGPKYGDKISEIEDALSRDDYELKSGELEVAGEVLKPEMFAAEKCYSTDIDGDLIETSSSIFIVE